MQDFLSKMIGRKVDIFCGGASSLRGEVVKVEGGVLHLKDEKQMSYAARDKSNVECKARDDHEHRAGLAAALKDRSTRYVIKIIYKRICRR